MHQLKNKTKQKNLGACSCKTCSRNASVVNGFQGVAVQLLMCFRVVVGVDASVFWDSGYGPLPRL